jgi:drug/metabolite transporter (DMT)-like permease
VNVDARKSKITLVFLTMLGVWLISFDDLSRGIEMFYGDMYSLFAAMFYALYAVGLGILVKSDDFEFGSFLGFVGVINCLTTLPLLFVLHWQSIEILEVPPANDLYLVFIYSLLCSLLSEYFWAKTATLLGATFATVSYTLVTLPVGIIIDYFIGEHSQSLTKIYLGGVFLIVTSFIGISWLMDPEPEFVLTQNGLRAIKNFRKTARDEEEQNLVSPTSST